MSENLIEEILKIEWVMFTDVPDDGTASCKQNKAEFLVMRTSQFEAWPDNVQISYLNDLKNAQSFGRNLMTEKYARMMGLSSYLDHGSIIRQLPDPGTEAVGYASRITGAFMEWNMELFKTYPHLVTSGRPLYAFEDTPYQTSIETYLKGELLTYSVQTLRLLFTFVTQSKGQGVNLPAQILFNTVKHYGFHTLEEAEKKFTA